MGDAPQPWARDRIRMTDSDPAPPLTDPAVTDPEWRSPTEAPTPVTPVPFGKPWSIWFWGGLISTAGLALAVAPRAVLRILDAPVETAALPWVRFAGLLLLAYAMGYHVAGWTGQRTYMRASVVLRVF